MPYVSWQCTARRCAGTCLSVAWAGWGGVSGQGSMPRGGVSGQGSMPRWPPERRAAALPPCVPNPPGPRPTRPSSLHSPQAHPQHGLHVRGRAHSQRVGHGHLGSGAEWGGVGRNASEWGGVERRDTAAQGPAPAAPAAVQGRAPRSSPWRAAPPPRPPPPRAPRRPGWGSPPRSSRSCVGGMEGRGGRAAARRRRAGAGCAGTRPPARVRRLPAHRHALLARRRDHGLEAPGGAGRAHTRSRPTACAA
jgi:hypothetical protein